MAEYRFTITPPPMRPAPQPGAMRTLPYREPIAGRDYWVVDDALPQALAVRERCLASTTWEYGHPHTAEAWPGRRTTPALAPEELAIIEEKVRALTGAARLWVGQTGDGTRLNHNCAQVVGATEGACKPHTDSLHLCRFAAVLYLTPDAPADCGTAFYRQRLPDGRRGGNIVLPPHHNLADALGTRFVRPDSFVEDVRVENRCNRLLLYRANLIHSAVRYCGSDRDSARMAAVFFWMA